MADGIAARLGTAGFERIRAEGKATPHVVGDAACTQRYLTSTIGLAGASSTDA
eukprot:COSAG02_NODE_39315_length_418_cov_1.294671_1_plen_52_part_10